MTIAIKQFRDECMQQINFSGWPQTVDTWRMYALRMGLNASRIDWSGTLEVVAWRVLDEARKQGVSEAFASSRLAELLASTIPVNAASVEKTTNAIRAMLKLGEAAQIVLLAQANIMGDLPRSTVIDQIELAIVTLQNACAGLHEGV
jgi:hypothetical protein